VRPLLSELQVPEWQELAVDRRKWRKVLKSTNIVWCCYYYAQAGTRNEQWVGCLPAAQRYRVGQPRTQA
jgi:hypothetical protein